MFTKNAETMLKDYAIRSYSKEKIKINDRIYCYVGWGHSNVIVIEGDTSLILIDALDSDERSKRLLADLNETFHKPVKTIIFTHGHPDHRAGAGSFGETNPEVICFAPQRPVLKYMEKINPVLMKRTVRQFGYRQTDEENITQGLGIREGHVVGDGKHAFLPPTTVYNQSKVTRIIDGVSIEMISAVGETDDQIFVWLPEDQVLCCGDNYYGCWPNLYAIRGSQYRDIATWVDSLKEIMSYPSKAVLPGHTMPLIGEDRIKEVLGNFTSAIEFVLLETLDCMNAGMSESQTVEAVKLPEKYLNLPYLGEFYGTVEWSVRAVYNGYFGWFDGDASNLFPLPDQVFAAELVKLSGAEKILNAAEDKLKSEEYQMAVQLSNLLLLTAEDETGKNFVTAEMLSYAKSIKAKSFLALGRLQTSANGRHYYMESARELME